MFRLISGQIPRNESGSVISYLDVCLGQISWSKQLENAKKSLINFNFLVLIPDLDVLMPLKRDSLIASALIQVFNHCHENNIPIIASCSDPKAIHPRFLSLFDVMQV